MISDTKGNHRKQPMPMGGRNLSAGREHGIPVARKQDYLGGVRVLCRKRRGDGAEREKSKNKVKAGPKNAMGETHYIVR